MTTTPPICTTFEPYGTGRFAERGGLLDQKLLAKMLDYKRSWAKRHRILFLEEVPQKLSQGQYWISTKIDGELWFLVKQNGQLFFATFNGRVLDGIALAKEAEKLLRKVDSIVIPGELFVLSDAGRPRVGMVSRALHEPADENRLRFRAFDLMEEGSIEWLQKPYEARLERLTAALLGAGEKVGVVLTERGDAAAVSARYRDWVSSSQYEGLVVRAESGISFKLKPTFTVDAVVVAFGERVIGTASEMREMTVALIRDNGDYQILGSVGNGFSEEDRVAWHQRLSGMVVPSKLRLANREGTLCKFVRPEIVVEIKVSDLLDTDTADVPVRRMALKYDAASGWEPLDTLPIAAMLFPIFQRERTDKPIDAAHVGLDQIYSRLPFEDRSASAHHVERKPGEVIRRAAYVKGETAVRKYVAIRHHENDPTFPKFVVHFTDFSAGRKDPLDTSIRVASTEEKVDQLIKSWIAENVKKGWSEAR